MKSKTKGYLMIALACSALFMVSCAPDHVPKTEKAVYTSEVANHVDADHALQAIAAIYTTDVVTSQNETTTDAGKPANQITLTSVPSAVRYPYLTYSKGIGLKGKLALQYNNTNSSKLARKGIASTCRSFDCLCS